MADLKYSVDVDNANAIRSLKQLETAVGAVGSAFKALAAGISVGALASFSDATTNLRNKLALLSDSQEQAMKTFQGVAAVAISARSDLAATGDLYFRIARAADSLGISSQEAAQITESVAKALSASGQSAKESAGPLLQLGQALQSGTFQGDELRSILEGLPSVAKALADSLGVPVGALKTMGSQGQITSQDFVAAMRKARDSIEQDFAKTVPTISQAFNTLKANLSIAFANFEQTTQTGQRFAQSIEYLGFMIFQFSKNIDSIIGPLTTFIKIVAGIAAFTLVGRILAGIGAAASGLTKGISDLGRGFSTAKDFVVNFGGVMGAVGRNFTGFAGVVGLILKPLGTVLKILASVGAAVAAITGLDKAIEWFKSLGDSNSQASQDMAAYREELDKFKSQMDATAGAPAPAFLDPGKMKKVRDELDQIVISYQRQGAELQKRLGFEQSLIGATEQQRTVKQALFDLENNYLTEVNKLTDQYREKSQSKNKEDQAALPFIQEALAKITQNYQEQIGAVTALVKENTRLAELEKQRLAFVDFVSRAQSDQAKQIRDITAEMDKMNLSELEKKYYDIARAADEYAKSAIEAENARRRGLGFDSMTAAEELKYYQVANTNVRRLQEAYKQQYEQSRTWAAGWSKAFREYIDDATNAAKQAENIFKRATQGLEDMFVNFVKTGKLDWKNFVAGMAEEILRGQLRSAIASVFSQLNNGGDSLLGRIGEFFGLKGMGGSQATKGQSANNPMFVYDVASAGAGAGFGGQQGGGFGIGSQPPMISGGGIGGALSGIWDGLKNVVGGISSSIGNVFSGISNTIGNIFGGSGGGGGGSFLGNIVSSIGDLFGGFFANGGTLGAGKFGIAGERGPELISGPATITPMSQAVTYNINAVDAASFKAMIAADPTFIHAVAQQGGKGIARRY